MKDLIQILDEITKYGLEANLALVNKEEDLERFLVALYAQYFTIQFKFDDQDYADFDRSMFPNVVENVKKNFPDFGWYHSILNCYEILQDAEIGAGDAIDDLSDIIYDVLEIKWRLEHNSLADGLWFFEFIFNSHTQQHIIDLLNYLKAKNG